MKFGSILLMLIVPSLVAADTLLSLDQAVALALKQGYSLATADIQRQTAAVNAKAADANLLPGLSTSASASYQQTLEKNPATSSSEGVSIGMDYDFTPAAFSSAKAAHLQQQAALNSYEQAQNDIALAASRGYIDVVYAQAAIGVEQANLDYQLDRLKQVEAFHSAGTRSIADVLQQKTAAAEAQARQLQARQTFERLKMNYFDLLRLPVDAVYSFDTVIVLNLVNRLAAILTDSMTSVNNRPTPAIIAQEGRMAAASARRTAAKLAWVPSVNLSLDASINQTNYNTAAGKSAIPSTRAGAGVTFPIFDKLRRTTTIRSAELDFKSAGLLLDDLKRSNDLAVRQALLDFSMARQQVDVAAVRLAAARQSLDAINERYNLGASTLTEVASVNAAFLNASNADLQATINTINAWFSLNHTLGTIMQEITALSGKGSNQ
jgi:outer membrane protein